MVLQWYGQNKRLLPWRETTDPYHILVSEFMLQQTQVSRVIGYYEKFLKKYPTVSSLAKSQTRTLLAMWSGLGYNRRALYLRETAKIIHLKYKGIVPDNYDELLQLPGVGDYLANAVLAFAFNRDVCVVDANVRRVFIVEFGLAATVTQSELKSIVTQFIPRGNCCEWYNALMDYGSGYSAEKKRLVVPITRQSRFEGSARQIRGEVIRIVLERKSILLNELEVIIDDSRLEKILKDLVVEGFIKNEGGRVSC